MYHRNNFLFNIADAILIVVGDLCSYNAIDDPRAKDPDSFEDFDEYSHFLSLECPNIQKPFVLSWTANTNSTNDLYYNVASFKK